MNAARRWWQFHMAFFASVSGGELLVTASADPITEADWLGLFDCIAAADPQREAGHGVFDVSAVTDFGDPTIETLHRVAVHSHLQYPQGPEFRVAFLLSDRGVGSSLLELYGPVVSLLAGTSTTAPGQFPTGRAFTDRAAGLRWARPEPPELRRVDESGYVATFTGLLTLYGIEDVRQQAVEMFEPGELRWAVMDLSSALLRTVVSVEDEQDQLQNAHQVVREVQRSRTDSLRLGLVADHEVFGAAIDILATVAEHGATPWSDLSWSMERFATVDAAVAWAQGESGPGC